MTYRDKLLFSSARPSPAADDRATMIARGYSILAEFAEADPTISGATLILPSGETLHVPARREGGGA